MAFFDKLNDLAKSVKDAANDAVETTRIKSRISSEKRAVDEACRKIGEYYYAKRAGDMGPVDDDILEYCIEIDEHMRVISELEAYPSSKLNSSASARRRRRRSPLSSSAPPAARRTANRRSSARNAARSLKSPLPRSTSARPAAR